LQDFFVSKIPIILFLRVILASDDIYTRPDVGTDFSERLLFFDIFSGLVMGPFSPVGFTYPQFGSLITPSAFIFVRMLSFSLFGSFEAPAVEASLCPGRSPSTCPHKGQTRFLDGTGDNHEVDSSVEYEIRERSEFFK
jgi:hypothetical protein